MSENIQSIANGSFVLGNTNELTFSAGPGIKVDSPSEGVVRIGNDETVLWSGSVSNSGTLVLSESPTAFDYLRLEFGAKRAGTTNVNVITMTVPAGIPNYGISHLFKSNPNSTASEDVYESYAYYSGCDTTAWNKVFGAFTRLGGTITINNGWTNMYKIVGINRKEV